VIVSLTHAKLSPAERTYMYILSKKLDAAAAAAAAAAAVLKMHEETDII